MPKEKYYHTYTYILTESVQKGQFRSCSHAQTANTVWNFLKDLPIFGKKFVKSINLHILAPLKLKVLNFQLKME